MSKDLSFTFLGALPSEPDYRDVKDATLAAPRTAAHSTDLGPVQVFDQEKIGICTTSIATYVEWLYWKKTGVYTKLSRRFIYSVGKNLIDEAGFEGSSLRTMLKVVYNYGACPESIFPSEPGNMSHAEYMDINAIPAIAWKEALKFKIGGYVSIPADRESLLQGIFKYGLLYTRMIVGKEWWTTPDGISSWDPKKIMPLKAPAFPITGHAVTHKSYQEQTEKTRMDLRNSWGIEWGEKGDGWHLQEDYSPTEAWAVTLDKITNDLPSADEFKWTFTKNLTRGSSGEEVLKLQIALMILGHLDFVQPKDRGFYGPKTQEAVKDFLISQKITPHFFGLYFGPRSQKAMNQIFG